MQNFTQTKKEKVIIAVVVAILVLILGIFATVRTMEQTKAMDPELRRAMTYKQVETGEENTNSEFVQFDAFFLRDLNGDGYAEKVRGTCKEVGTEDTLYMELNVLTNGYLKDAKITINGDKNFYLQTAIVKDNEVKENYIKADTREIGFKNIQQGTQKLMTAMVRSGDYAYDSRKMAALGKNINNYSKTNSLTLTGTHVEVDDKGNEKETFIEKTVKFDIDWYGTATAQIRVLEENEKVRNISILDQEIILEFPIGVQEIDNKLMLKKSYLEGTIPLLNGYEATSVEITGANVNYSYNKTTRKFTAQRDAIVNDQGTITAVANSDAENMKRYNKYNLKVTYPLEAYQTLGVDTFEYRLPIKAYYEGYNNTNREFTNPYRSNILEDTFVTTFRKEGGDVAKFNVRVGKYAYDPQERYVVSKQKPINIYQGVSTSEKDDIYLVRWEAYTGSGAIEDKIVMKERTEEGILPVDHFIKADSSLENMEEVTKNIGIYFSDPTKLVGNDGKIEVYDDITGKRLVTFDKSNWSNYDETNPYYYEVPVEHVRIETSNVRTQSSFFVYHIKELNDEIITTKYTKEQFNNLKYIRSTLEGYFGNQRMDSDVHEAHYEAPISVASIHLSQNAISTQETQKNFEIRIATNTDERSNETKWTNGAFLVKLPKDIIDLDISQVKISNNQVEVTNYEQYVEEGNYYIKINTESEEPQNYVITVICDITADPRIPTTNEEIELYAYNEYNANYYYEAEDIYDINHNLNTVEMVNKQITTVTLTSPNSLLTAQSASNYDEKGSTVIAPQVANVSKEQKQATIFVEISNNYSNTISEVKILGKIPFTNNTYVINGNNMGSNFDTIMTDEGILLPEELKEVATIYYSEQENPTNDLEDSKNGWTIAPEDFSRIKTYLVDLGEKSLARGEKHQISYHIVLPEGLNYNQVSYSHHAVYFSLDTTEGRYRTQTEPNKLGFRIAKQYDLEVTKYQTGKNKVVSGATYRIREEGEEGKTRVTGNDGKLSLKNLYIDTIYTLEEIKSPVEYELNNETIQFVANQEDDGHIVVKKLNGNVRNIQAVQKEGEDYKVQIEVEDEVKAKLAIVKVEEETNHLLKNVRYRLKGKGMPLVGKVVTTNANGEATLEGISIGETYTLEEEVAQGYYLANPITFMIKHEEEQYVAAVTNGKIQSGTIIVNDEIPTLRVTIENEKIPTYNLAIQKIVKNETTPIAGVTFGLYHGEERIGNYVTNEVGEVVIENLYQYVEEKEIDQTYTLKELQAPEGYAKVEDITFYAYVQDGLLNLHIKEGEIKESSIDGNTIHITIEDAPTFKLVKQDGITKEPLANVKFAIYNYETGRPAVNTKGEVIGQKEVRNGRTYYVVTTDEKGEITENLPEGLYKAVEIETQEQYALAKTEEERTSYFGIGQSKEEESTWVEEEKVKININDDNGMRDVLIDKDGNYVVVGTTVENENNQGMNDAYIGKYDKDFNLIWEQAVGYESDDVFFEVIEEDDVYIVAGRIIESEEDRYGTSRAYIVKFNKETGNKVFEKIYDKTGWVNDQKVIKKDLDGGYIVAEFGQVWEVTEHWAGILIKFDKEFNEIWSTPIASDIEDVVCTDDGYIAVGKRYGNKLLIAKFDQNGNITKTKLMDSNSSESGFRTVIQDNDGNFVAAGAITLEGDRLELYVVKFDHELNILKEARNVVSNWNWNNRYFDIIQNSRGEYVIVGELTLGGVVTCYDKELQKIWEYKSDTRLLSVQEINPHAYVISGRTDSQEGKLMLLESVVSKPEIPKTQLVTVNNNKKEFNITTEVEEKNGIKGGSISGEGRTPYETVVYGNDNTKEIKMIPEPGYVITKITINGQEVEFERTEDGSYVLPPFTNITEDKHIVVTYIEKEKQAPEIIVHHYIKGTTTKVAPDERYTGELDEEYTTKPRVDLSDYELIKDEQGEYKIPQNASGTYQKETQEIIYEYEQRKVLLTVHHYIEGTTIPVPLLDGTEALDVTDEQIEGTPYTTTPVIPNPMYTLVEMPTNYQGTYERPEVIVTYYYATTPSAGVIVHHIDADTKEIIAEDDKLSGRYGNPYTTTQKPELEEEYEFVTKTDNWQGSMIDTLIEVTYEYRTKYNVQLTKYKEGTTDTIQGVEFNVKGEGFPEEGKKYITNQEGILQIKGLLLGRTYTLQETMSNPNYLRNDEIITIQATKEGNKIKVSRTGNVKDMQITMEEGSIPQVKIQFENEPKYQLNIVKYQGGKDIPIEGVRFRLTGNELESSQTYITDEKGRIEINGLIPEEEYTLTETKTKAGYILNEKSVRFRTYKEGKELHLEVLEGNLRNQTVTQVAKGSMPQVQFEIDNEKKYNIQITKQEAGTDNTISDVEFLVTGKDMTNEGKKYTTNTKGIITITGLEPEETYTIQETQAKGYYVDETKSTIIVRRVGGVLQAEYKGRKLVGTPKIVEDGSGTATVLLNFENESIPKYNLEISKKATKTGKLLSGAKFEIQGLGRDYTEEKEYTTGENGTLTIENLYENEEYTLKEVHAPIGYKLNEETIKFKVVRNGDNLTLSYLTGEGQAEEIAQGVIQEGNTIKISLENEPLFKLEKIDAETGKPLAGAKFVIQDLEGNIAKDVLGNEIGVEENINGTLKKVVSSDENGVVTVEVAPGLYQVTEVQAPQGYTLPENPTQYFGIDASREPKKGVQNMGEKDFSGSGSNVVERVVATKDSGSIIAGHTTGSMTIGDQPVSSGGLVIKLDENNQVKWVKNPSNKIYGIVETKDGSIIAVR